MKRTKQASLLVYILLMHLHCPDIGNSFLGGIVIGPGVCNVRARVLLIHKSVCSQEAENSLNEKRVTLRSFLDDLFSSQRLAGPGQNGKESYIASDCRTHDFKRL